MKAARVDSLAIAAGGLRAKGRLSFKTGVFGAIEPPKAANRALWDKNENSKPWGGADPSQGAGEVGNAGDAVDPSQYERIEDGAYILGIGSDRVLDIAGGSMADKGNAQIYEGNESTSQRFRITNVGRDANHEWIYCITNIGSGRVLEAQGGKTSSGTNVSQYGFNGSEAQLWYIRQVEGEDGTIRYCFVNYKSGLLMTVDATDVSDAANVVLKKQRETRCSNGC